jgi:1-deoxy-D-xylulose-5-phosphate reductoisomerase
VSAPRDVVLLGSTGSIGTQLIEVVRANPDRFRIVAIGAGGGNVGQFAAQALTLGVEAVGVAKASATQDLQLAFYAEAQKRGYASGEFKLPKIIAGPRAMADLAEYPCDIVANAVVGSLGLAPTLSALKQGRTLALANKESLVAGGTLVRKLAKPGQIVPIDSEHSALAQCMRAGRQDEIRKLILTASGGPFRGWTIEQMRAVTPAQAFKHPTWDMGPVITINSATLVNKALEVIEAHELYDLPYDMIDVVVHPQSVIHSMVEYADGSTIAQASPPDMKLPISLALGWPDRVPDTTVPVDWTKANTWTFEPLDHGTFPAIKLAKQAGSEGRLRPAIYNAANEECVSAFVDHGLPFLAIVGTLEQVLNEAPDFGEPAEVEDVLAAERWARKRAAEIISVHVEEAG